MKTQNTDKKQPLVYTKPQLVELGDVKSVQGYSGQYNDGVGYNKTDQA